MTRDLRRLYTDGQLERLMATSGAIADASGWRADRFARSMMTADTTEDQERFLFGGLTRAEIVERERRISFEAGRLSNAAYAALA
jgi:hypothetical protein